MTFEKALNEMKKGKSLTRPYSLLIWRYEQSTKSFCIKTINSVNKMRRIDERCLKDVKELSSWIKATDWIYV